MATLAQQLTRPSAPAFLVLFTFDTIARAVLITVLPLQAYALLGTAQSVSVLYLAASAFGLCASLSVPWLVKAVGRRGAVICGSLCLVAAVVLFSLQALWALLLGLVLQMFGGATINIYLNLYILDNVPKADLTRFEPNRMLLAGFGWMAGPYLGIALAERAAPWLPFALSGIFSLLLLGYLLLIGVPRARDERKDTGTGTNPLRFVRRFFAQPRLSLAWLLSVGRSAWWNMFFIYAPIYAVETGLGKEAGGLITSIGSAGLFTVTFWGWMGRRNGIRWLLILGYVATAVTSALVGLTMAWPYLGAALLVASAFAASITDGPGNVPFLRAVHPHERAGMTSVYATYRETGRLSVPAVYSVVLLVFPLSAVFITGGATMLVLAYFSRYLPHRFGRDRRTI